VRVYMATGHPAFDLTLEMLCCFGSRPITRAELAHDLKMESGQQVRSLFLDATNRFGIGFVKTDMVRRGLSKVEIGRFVVAEPHRGRTRELCQRYWARLYK